MSADDYSKLYAVFRRSGVVDRESFHLPTYDPDTGARNGAIHADDFAHAILRALGRCGEEGACHRCSTRPAYQQPVLADSGRPASLQGPPPTGLLPSPADIEAARTPKGGWTRAQLTAWGIPWPPPKGWKEELTARWQTAEHQTPPGRP